MKKKILIGLGILVFAIVALFGIQQFLPKQEVQVGAKTINVVVIDEGQDNTELFKGEIHTDAETLGDALAGAPEIKMVTDKGDFGRFIIAMCDVEQGSFETGPWWLYSSDNNESCKAQGMCMGIDDTLVADGDNFTFTLTSSFN